MSIESGHFVATAQGIGRRCALALAVSIANVATVVLCYWFDVLNVSGGESDVSCLSLGLTQRFCDAVDRGAVIPQPLLLPAVIATVFIALGLYDPRPLVARLEQNRCSPWLLAISAAGAVICVSPYLMAAAGGAFLSFTSLAPYLLVVGALISFTGLLFWLSEPAQLVKMLGVRSVLVVLAMILGNYGLRELEDLGWRIPTLQGATFNAAIFFLKLIGETVVSDPDNSTIGINGFSAVVTHGCTGIAGILMVSTVMTGYILVVRKRLEVGRALLLIPVAAFLSWVFNGMRIATLLMLGSYGSPELAVKGFHTNAGWLIFCALSAAMLVAAENISWFHRRRGLAETPAMPLLNDPVVVQIAPFIVLLASSLLAGAVFLQPESGYPLRAVLMAAAVLLFRKVYRAEIQTVDAVPLIAGALVAVVWLVVKAGGSALTAADILGPVSQGAVILWVFFRIIGTVLLVPFIEEMFFRGYLLHRLNFGGLAGKGTALALSSALFGALHANIWLASASGLIFGLLALRRGRVFDAVVAHSTANSLIAAWALWAGDWSVI